MQAGGRTALDGFQPWFGHVPLLEEMMNRVFAIMLCCGAITILPSLAVEEWTHPPDRIGHAFLLIPDP
jgi:hypothetical protein